MAFFDHNFKTDKAHLSRNSRQQKKEQGALTIWKNLFFWHSALIESILSNLDK